MLHLRKTILKLLASSVVPNFWVGGYSGSASTTTSYDIGYDLVSTDYTTKTGKFIVIGHFLLKTSRFTSRALIKVNGSVQGLAGTNKTALTSLMPTVCYNGTKGATYKVAFAIGSQDSGTTASVEVYNHNTFLIFDIGGGAKE